VRHVDLGRAELGGIDMADESNESKQKGPSKFEGKEYKEHIDDLIASTPCRETDLDQKAVTLFDALHSAGKADKACQHLKESLKALEREKVSNWRAYTYSLLRSFDEAVYKEMKGDAQSKGRPRGQRENTGDRAKKGREAFPLSDFQFRADAPAFVPGGSGYAVAAAEEPPKVVGGAGGLPPWWIINGVKPAGPEIDRGTAKFCSFSTDQQEEFGVDQEGNVSNQAKFDAAIASLKK